MPTIAPGLTISESLYELIQKSETECCAILKHIFQRIAWAQANPPSISCDCDECKRVRRFRKRITRLLNKDRIGDYFTFREREGMISFMPSGRTQEFNEDGTWKRPGRQEIKPAKWIRSLIHPRLSSRLKDHIFTKFDTVVKAEEAASKVEFMETGFEEAYDIGNYATEFDSCMWNEDVGPFYRAMGATVIVAKNARGQFRGRAVLWPKVHTGGQTISFLDRIYCDKPEVQHLFKQYAKDQGWHHKLYQSRDSAKDVVSPDGRTHFWTLRVIGNVPDDLDFYPYLDTFCGGDDEGLVNTDKDVPHIYHNTDGTRSEEDLHEGEVQDVDGNWIDEDYAVAVGDDYYESGDSRICFCENRGEHILRSDAYEVDLGRRTVYIHEDYVTRA